jgi:hypothetical protein
MAGFGLPRHSLRDLIPSSAGQARGYIALLGYYILINFIL